MRVTAEADFASALDASLSKLRDDLISRFCGLVSGLRADNEELRRRLEEAESRWWPSAPPLTDEEQDLQGDRVEAEPGRAPRSRSKPRSRTSRPRSRRSRLRRSRSKSVHLSVRMPHNQDATGEHIEAEVVERPALNNGEPVWQAQITMPQGGSNHTGKPRVFNIRGPPRKDQDQAERDARQLTEISMEGPKAVRALANELHRL